ncbi:MAG: DEAD/DEAH box helicase, partial [Acidobacteria bacterium]|nr:DEAD/DEAH box helicase [Acidobacteriota bacterium]
DDGIVFRLPESERPPELAPFFPAADEVEELVTRHVGRTALFAARFRENAARALLLPRRRPGLRSPLWAQRKRAFDLLGVAARHGSFPVLLETYRECLRDVFDLPGLVGLLREVESRRVRVVTADSRQPSPFAASLLFNYVANYIYDGDAPLAERRAQALSVDTAQLRELLGEAELRELLDAEAIASVERAAQRLEGRRVAGADALHELLLALGDLTDEEIRDRAAEPDRAAAWIEELVRERRAVRATIAGERRVAAAEDAARLRDALGVPPPAGLPSAFLEAVPDPLGDLVSRYARTHGPFRAEQAAARLGLPLAPVRAALERLAESGRVHEGEFLPGGRGREWCDAGVLRAIKRRSLARLRREAEPVPQEALGRFLPEWHGITGPRHGVDALLAAIEQLSGAPVPASILEREVLPARVADYRPSQLDALCASGEVVWRGIEPIGPGDGRIALYLAGQAPLLAPPPPAARDDGRVRAALARRGALFFADLVAETGGFPGDVLDELWALVWAGAVTNDTLAPLRSLLAPPASARDRALGRAYFGRRSGPPGSEGRWSLVSTPGGRGPGETERRLALATALLARHGILTREAVHAEPVAGGFAAVYPVLKAMEDAGRVRRGYFVAGLGATQFALPGAEGRLRELREAPEQPEALVLAAADPANPYGAALPWPERDGARPQRAAGAQVVLVGGRLAAWAGRTERNLLTFLPGDEPERSRVAAAISRALAGLVESGRRRAVLVAGIDGDDPSRSPLAPHLAQSGFVAGSRGWLRRRAPGR